MGRPAASARFGRSGGAVARIEWVEHRLQNWARWTLAAGSGGLGYARVDLADADAGRDGYVEARIPISDVEAAETDQAIGRLTPPGLALTVREVYVGPGGIKDKARRLCCAEATVHARIGQAHLQLARDLAERQRVREAERRRVELLQQGVRPG